MPSFRFQSPLDQPTNTLRLLDVLDQGLKDRRFDSLRIAVAYAKTGPLLRLHDSIRRWRAAGKSIDAVFGIDQCGTSHEALLYAMENFSTTRILHVDSGSKPTFHSKIYMFDGPESAVSIIGSNNLTVGGTETNFESFVESTLSLPADSDLLQAISKPWNDVDSIAVDLNHELLSRLVDSQKVIPERLMRRRTSNTKTGTGIKPGSGLGACTVKTRPQRSLPETGRKELNRIRSKYFSGQSSKAKGSTSTSTWPASNTAPLPDATEASALAIQIVPHKNGEVFLSKTAVNQDRGFFGYPFTGLSRPKKLANPAYPHRSPAPKVNITLYNKDEIAIFKIYEYELTTVYYTIKSEIRITVPMEVVAGAPKNSILVMAVGEPQNLDYQLDIYAPGSGRYDDLLASCNQTMPSGGKGTGRKFGWL